MFKISRFIERNNFVFHIQIGTSVTYKKMVTAISTIFKIAKTTDIRAVVDLFTSENNSPF